MRHAYKNGLKVQTEEVKKKIGKMRAHFNLDNYLERNITIEESENIKGTRTSFLNFLQNCQDKKNYCM